MPTSPAADLFDAYGLPAGALAEALWPAMCARLEETLDADGWDQPTRLFSVANPVTTEAHLGHDVDSVLRMMDTVGRAAHRADTDPDRDPDSAATMFGVAEIGETGDHPIPALWGEHAPPEAAALMLAFEGWTVLPKRSGDSGTDPYAGLAYADRPDRLEMRSVLMVTRSGQAYSAQRLRGYPVSTGPAGAGMLQDVLKRVLGAPTDPPAAPAHDALARLVLTSAIRAGKDITGDGPDAQEWRRAGGDATKLAAFLATLTMACVIQLAWLATDEGRHEVPADQRDAVAEMVRRSAAHENLSDSRIAILTLTAAASRRRYTDLITMPVLAQFLPDGVTETGDWADDGLLSRCICDRALPTQDDLLGVARDQLGDSAAQALADVLAACGWYVSDADLGGQTGELGCDITMPNPAGD